MNRNKNIEFDFKANTTKKNHKTKKKNNGTLYNIIFSRREGRESVRELKCYHETINLKYIQV